MFTTAITHSRRLVVAGAAALTVALALAASPSPAQADPYDYLMPPPGACNEYGGTSLMWQAFVGECLASAVRRNAGRTALATTGFGLMMPAQAKAADTLACPSGDPHYACGRSRDYHLVRRDYRAHCPSGPYAENIYRAWGGHPYTSVREAVRVWVNSYVHRVNLLNPSWTHHGMGAKTGTYNGSPNGIAWVHYMCR
jgi:hypothetical protein